MSIKKILISGAGIAGLTLARQFKRLNIPFTIIEKRSNIATTGAGIALPANAVGALRYLGLGKEIDIYGHRVKEIIYSKPSGRVLSKASLLQSPLNTDNFVAMHRNTLNEILLSDDISKDIIFDTKVKHLVQKDNKVLVNFDSPHLDSAEYCAVVGTDGLNSSIRQLAFNNVNLVDLAVTNWRWVCDHSTQRLQPTYMLGSQDAFMVYPISKTSVYCYAHFYDPQETLINSADHQAILKNKFKHYGGIAPEMLAKLPESSSIIPGRLRSVPFPLFAKGRVALAGDASNACSPMLQQGAACAFEDTIILSELLNHFPVEDAFKFYSEYRKERVTWIINSSDNPMKSIVKMNSPLTLFARDLFIRFAGPLNVKGWRTLLATDPLAALPDYIDACRQQKDSACVSLS